LKYDKYAYERSSVIRQLFFVLSMNHQWSHPFRYLWV